MYHLARNFPIFGTIKFNGMNPIIFLKIFHTSKSNRKFWNVGYGMYIKPYKELFNRILLENN